MSDEVSVWKPAEFEGTDLLPVPKENLLAPGEVVVGRENIEMEDLIVPVLTLLHGTSDPVQQKLEGCVPGMFHLTTGDQVFRPPIRGILVHHSKSRAMFPDSKRAVEADIRCIARDNLTGDHFGDCSECGRSEWEYKDGKLCDKSNNFVLLTSHGLALMRFRRTSYPTSRKFLSELNESGVNMWHHPIRIGTTKGHKEVGGKTILHDKLELKWLVKETVPPHVREQCHEQYEQLAAAHDKGKLGGESDGSE